MKSINLGGSGKSAPVKLFATFNRPANTTAYAVNDVVSDNGMMTFSGYGENAKGIIGDVLIETTDTAFAGATVRLWLFDSEIASIPADNAPYTNQFANSQKRLGGGYVDVTFDPLLAGSNCVIGKVQPSMVIATTQSTFKAIIKTLTAVTPASSSTFNVSINMLM